MNNKKSVIWFSVINISIILFAIIYTLIFTFEKDLIMDGECKFQSLFHLYCPGCGGSRSLKAFLSFDFLKSFILYPPLIISFICILCFDIRFLINIRKSNSKKASLHLYFILIPVSIILTFIIRNLLLICFGIDTVGDFLG